MSANRAPYVAAGIVLAVLLILVKYTLLDRGPDAESNGVRPHPDYPTPEAAGTQAVFLLEAPPAAVLPGAVPLPDRQGLEPGLHAHCELDGGELTCGPALEAPPGASAHWQVWRRAGRAALAERRRPDGRAEETLALARLPTGEPVQVARLDIHGTLDWVSEIGAQGRLVHQRRRNGLNLLPGCGALRLELDAHGRPVAETCLAWSGRPMLDRAGVATRRLARDEHGLVMETIHLDLGGRPTLDHAGIHRVRIERGEDGRPREIRRFDLEGAPRSSSLDGCAGVRLTYEPRGLEASRTCLGPDGQPAPDARGVLIESLTHDARGCLSGRTHLDAQGRPTPDARGVAGIRLVTDEACHEQESTCLDATGRARACGPGRPARQRLQRDARGQVVSVRAHGPDGEPAQDAGHRVFEVRQAWDPRGNRIRQACYDPAGQPIECGSTGFHELVSEPDEAGRVVRERFLDAMGNRTTNLGTWERRLLYDNYDHLVESRNLGPDGELVEALGQAVRRQLFDPGHRLFAVLLEDARGRPARHAGCFTGVDCPQGAWHAVRVVRDTHGRPLQNQYFDHERRLMAVQDCARARCFE